MAQSDHVGDPKFSTPIDVCVLSGNIVNLAAGSKVAWRPFVKSKINCVHVDVAVAGGSAGVGVNIYKNGGSIGTVVVANSAAGYRGTWVPAAGAGTATSAIYDTTDTLDIRNIGSDSALVANVTINYQNQY